MEINGESPPQRWRFEGNERLTQAGAVTVRGVLNMVMQNLDENDSRPVIPLGHGDPSAFPSFRTTHFAEDAVCAAVRSANFNGYSSTVAIAEHLSKELPNKLSADDVFLTIGCTQALEAIVTVLARPGANILLPRPGFPYYEARAGFSGLEVRHFDLIPERDWEVDLDSVDALADENTAAMVIINPGNPCGNVFKYQHLKKVAETAKKLGMLVIADEVYGGLTFGNNPFVPMGVFASIAPIITLGSISKRWIVPGWRLGWLVTNDPNGILTQQGIVDSIKGFLNISSDPATFMQGAVGEILENTPSDFFEKIVSTLRECADICYEGSKDIPCITCPTKPQGSMFAMVGFSVGLKNWLRVTFAIEPSSLDDAFRRIKAFYQRHAKKQ
ncbi:Tyrosine transaminase family protein [Perilla frutescens var. hirtella]|uniref:Tyrosine transaminase family protein n=1 Tax=Perilla frutescens var. hirtella TaxID=608512 RepID=A0AAD4JJ03_PERFH|nr:Tyrosine transaminase family protein [Perilla frutescens var. hirtella]